MRTFKKQTGGYITAIGTGDEGTAITDAEYSCIKTTIEEKPVAPEGYGYRLKSDLSWELYELTHALPATDEVDVVGGTPNINGRSCDCGQFTVTGGNITNGHVVAHNLGSVPSAAFVWVLNPCYDTRGILGKYSVDGTDINCSASVTSANRVFTVEAGGGGEKYRLLWDDSTITICCDGIYPLLNGLTYQWMVIA